MFNRTDRSFVSIWWWTIVGILSLALLLCVASLFMVMAASLTIALSGYNEWHL